MNILSLDFTGFRGFSFKLKFTVGSNVLIGMNGCGKTTILELLAILTGHDDATNLIRTGEKLDYAKVIVQTKTGPKTLIIHGWELDKIAEFKRSLPSRTSFVLQQESLRDDSLVTERREAIAGQKNMFEWLEAFDLGLRRSFAFRAGQAASLLVSETGAQRYLLTVGMRRAPPHVPMLIEHPERSLHINIRRTVLEYYRDHEDQQLIVSTHCPEVLSSIERLPNGKYGSFGKSSSSYHEDSLIELSDKEHVWT
jgi:predicted ATP-dependent endonuclease of OLD family